MPRFMINDTEFELSVVKYNSNSDWSEIRLAVKNAYMNYCDCCELLQGCEVDYVIEKLNDLIYDRISKETDITFIEPDITMHLSPSHKYVSQRGKIWCSAGHGTIDCYLDIKIHFRDLSGVYGGEEWTIMLNRNEIMMLLDGVETEVGKLKKSRETVGLIGVSFIGNWDDIYWYRYNGDDLWNRRFVKVEHKGQERFGMVEYVRNYDVLNLPCEISELKDIIEIVPNDEKTRELLKEWELSGNNYKEENTLKMTFADDTQFIIEKKSQLEYRVAVCNKFINYDKTLLLFCEGDKQYITDNLAMLIYGSLKEVTVVGTSDPDLTFVLCPKSAKTIRSEGDGINSKDIQGNTIEEYYTENAMKIELDLCTDGVYGNQYWTRWLSAEETENFATQWVLNI